MRQLLLLLLVHVNARVEKLDTSAIAIDINDSPEQATRIDAREDDALLLVVNAIDDITGIVHIVVEYVVLLAILLVQCLCPEPGPVGQIGACVFGQ